MICVNGSKALLASRRGPIAPFAYIQPSAGGGTRGPRKCHGVAPPPSCPWVTCGCRFAPDTGRQTRQTDPLESLSQKLKYVSNIFTFIRLILYDFEVIAKQELPERG